MLTTLIPSQGSRLNHVQCNHEYQPLWTEQALAEAKARLLKSVREMFCIGKIVKVLPCNIVSFFTCIYMYLVSSIMIHESIGQYEFEFLSRWQDIYWHSFCVDTFVLCLPPCVPIQEML